MKCCSVCGEWRSSLEFYADRRTDAKGCPRSRDGLHHACKHCEREAALKRFRERFVPKNTMTQPRNATGQFIRAREAA